MSPLKSDRCFRPIPRIRIWLEIDGRYAFGFGLSAMLRAINKTGSIKHAAAKLGKSYRYVWGRIKDAEKTLGRKLVETHVGGRDQRRSCLTDEARRLLADFEAVRLCMIRAVEDEFSQRPGWPALLKKTGKA
jgi:molybdate transport system regulatory protein